MREALPLSKILENPSIEKMVRYLGAYRVVEGDLGFFDKLARVRDIRAFVTVINDALRVKDRVFSKLTEGFERREYEVPALAEEKTPNIKEFIRRALDVGEKDVKEILTLAEQDPNLVAVTISALALAYSGIRSRR